LGEFGIAYVFAILVVILVFWIYGIDRIVWPWTTNIHILSRNHNSGSTSWLKTGLINHHYFGNGSRNTVLVSQGFMGFLEKSVVKLF